MDNASKLAQEQMRAFIPVVFPTGLMITMDFTAIAAMFRVAWTPPLRYIMSRMAELIVEQWPDAAFAFTEVGKDCQPWELVDGAPHVKDSPECRLLYPLAPGDLGGFVPPSREEVGPLDLLHFSPRVMDNRTEEVKDEVTLSVATMGQDQRHRTIQRGLPRFTRGFYLPPVARELGLGEQALSLVGEWGQMMGNDRLRPIGHLLAPYGAMVRYPRVANLAAFIHEGDKRLCWCSQQEIYEVARQRREQLANVGHPVVPYLSPHCVSSGVCLEGVRCCGRDPVARKANPFPYREI